MPTASGDLKKEGNWNTLPDKFYEYLIIFSQTLLSFFVFDRDGSSAKHVHPGVPYG